MDISSDFLTDVFIHQFDSMSDNAQAEVVEAMVEHVETCGEDELRGLALRLVEQVATAGAG